MEKIPKQVWTESDLRFQFKLKELETHPLLVDWLKVETLDLHFSSVELQRLEKLRSTLKQNFKFWNEEELKMRFIAFILEIAGYQDDHPRFRIYLERSITAVIETIRLNVEADLMLAAGIGELIQHPYFCFHEYKRKKKKADDPVAQVLIAMLIAQVLNENDKPIYGCHVIGELWYFMVLHGKEYAISEPMSATNIIHLKQIVAILKRFIDILNVHL
ncbi:MAG: hypothetical protein RL329_2582 [Bacteroidota bacterium]|jgi:hypothetical protein